jgi:hypothetical protein
MLTFDALIMMFQTMMVQMMLIMLNNYLPSWLSGTGSRLFSIVEICPEMPEMFESRDQKCEEPGTSRVQK